MEGTAPPPLVTLSADFGPVYGAQVKAVLYRRLPPGHVVELVLDLPAHDVATSAFLLRHMAARFPAGTVHYAVVDPGVGGSRAPLAVRCADGSALVGPDNGLLMPLAEALGGAEAVVRLDPDRVAEARGRVSATFEGRDLFAPAAARIATGASPESLGTPHGRPLRLAMPEPERRGTRLLGRVVYVDRFGNAITDLPGEWIPRAGALGLRAGARTAERTLRRVRTYSDLDPGELGVLVSSFGLVELGARETSAARRLRVRSGAPIVLRLAASRASAPPRLRRRK